MAKKKNQNPASVGQYYFTEEHLAAHFGTTTNGTFNELVRNQVTGVICEADWFNEEYTFSRLLGLCKDQQYVCQKLEDVGVFRTAVLQEFGTGRGYLEYHYKDKRSDQERKNLLYEVAPNPFRWARHNCSMCNNHRLCPFIYENNMGYFCAKCSGLASQRVVDFARGIIATGRYGDVDVLADLLEQEGSAHQELIRHLRGEIENPKTAMPCSYSYRPCGDHPIQVVFNRKVEWVPKPIPCTVGCWVLEFLAGTNYVEPRATFDVTASSLHGSLLAFPDISDDEAAPLSRAKINEDLAMRASLKRSSAGHDVICSRQPGQTKCGWCMLPFYNSTKCLNDEEKLFLINYASANGARWRTKLLTECKNGTASAYAESIYNQIGEKGLRNIKSSFLQNNRVEHAVKRSLDRVGD